jgi:cytochrome P450
MPDAMIYENFLTAGAIENPYEVLRHARAESPVFLTQNSKGRPVYVVTTYALVKHAFENPDVFSSDFMQLSHEGSGSAEADAVLRGAPIDFSKVHNLLLNKEGHRHDRLRTLVNPMFSVGPVNALVPKLQIIIDELIDSFIERGECDLIGDFAVPLALQVILGIATLDQSVMAKAHAWSDAAMLRIGHMGTEEQEIEAAHLIVEMERFFYDLIMERRARPGNDLISDLIASKVPDEPPLTDEEILAFLNELLIAGNETSRHAMVGGIVLLLKHPEQVALLLADPGLMGGAVEEVLRFHSPGVGIWRIARKDTRLGDVDIPAGSAIMLRMDSANRDDAQFPEGEKFDIRRPNARTGVFFGYGTHFCLGQFLARKELLLAFQSILGRLKAVRLDEKKCDLRRQPHLIIHALRKVHLAFEPGTKALTAGNAIESGWRPTVRRAS